MQKKQNYLTKQQLFQILAKRTGLSKKNITLLFAELLNVIKENITTNGHEKFVLPGFFKLTTKYIPAQKEKEGVNPFTKQKMLFKAKAESRKVKIRVLKNLRDIAS